MLCVPCVLMDSFWRTSLFLSTIPFLPCVFERLLSSSSVYLNSSLIRLASVFSISISSVDRCDPNVSCSATRCDSRQSPQTGDMYQNFVILTLLFITCAFAAQTSPDDDDGVPVCVQDPRTVLSILWGCIATIFACTWLAVHPNVPGHNITAKGAVSCAIERAKIMAITILAQRSLSHGLQSSSL